MAEPLPRRRYSCSTAMETLEWMTAIADFLRPLKPILDAHVVNFFIDCLWDLFPADWIDCLRNDPVEYLLNIPSGLAQEHWPSSLQEFVCMVKCLSFPREPETSHPLLSDLRVASLSSVLVQGMNVKKQHEVEILAAVVSNFANQVGAQTIIDVGAGQGYLAQVLSFEYHLSVIAIDASLHHSSVTASRAEKIKKHYAAKMLKSGHASKGLKVPQTITSHVLSSDNLTAVGTNSIHKHIESLVRSEVNRGLKWNALKTSGTMDNDLSLCGYGGSSILLAGLHACGDLSVNMLRSFVECERVKAVVCVGCCYNLLSEDCCENLKSRCGFPMSKGAKDSGFHLGKNTRDLACQSAERWRSLTKDAALQNFDLHAFRAAFQLVLDKFFPETLKVSPSIGRRGKALRRQQFRRNLQSEVVLPESKKYPSTALEKQYGEHDAACAISERPDKYSFFEKFCVSGLDRLGVELSEDVNLLNIWKESENYVELVGPFWSLRAALGPVVETYILLDRLLFLQEQGTTVTASMVPLFNPSLSPRNVALVAEKPSEIF